MGFWSILQSLLGLGSDPTPAPAEKKRADSPRRKSSYKSDLVVHRATVTKVATAFAKVAWSGKVGFLHVSKYGHSKVEDLAAELGVGSQVEVIALGPSDRWPGEFIVSNAAVPEARARRTLGGLARGDRVAVEVTGVEVSCVRVSWKGAPGVIAATEWDHGHVDSLLDLAKAGEVLEVEVLDVLLPDGWEGNPRGRPASFRASARRCRPPRKVPRVPVTLAAIPFQVEFRPRVGPDVDVALRFVLEAVGEGNSTRAISDATGLPQASVLAMCQKLEAIEFLGPKHGVTRRGSALIKAMGRAAAFNGDPLEGLFVSAAPPGNELLPSTGAEEAAWPQGHPVPPSVRPAEEAFTRATGEELQGFPLGDFASPAIMKQVRAAAEDPWLMVFVRRSGRSLRAVRLEVEVDWLLAGLWAALEPAEARRPFRPSPTEGRRPAAAIRLLALDVKRGGQSRNKGNSPVLLWEPATNTLWHERTKQQSGSGAGRAGQHHTSRHGLIQHKERVFIPIPSELRARVGCAAGDELVPSSWVTLVRHG